MVQRKVPNSIGFQADHVKSDKRLGNLKPTSCQHQDGKNRGTDMKKKMKRSRSIKLSDMESLSSSSLRKTISRLGKPPTLSSPPAEATPQKQAVIKPSGGSPNYMKATSSSEARKERSQVSSSNTPPGSDSKNLRRTNSSSSSRLGSDSSNKSNKSLTKSYSLKLVRTLTKSPSFKPVRSAAKKCSRVALCADVNVQKATCSSTLKDSKFPAYLMLNPDGTESEGTSVLKVCPYTYCSLNGHHHTPLPPLKCFLKAKRRSLRAQKSSMLEVSSPRRVKPSGNQTEEINGELLKEVEMDFFIEIYDKSTADGRADATKKHAEADEEAVGFAGEPKEHSKSSFHGDEPAAEQENKDQVSENLSDASPHSEIGFEENLEGDFLKEHKTEDAAAGFPHFLSEEVRTGCYNNEIDTEGECHTTTEADDNISETSDMEWEEGQLSNSEIDAEVDYLNKLEKEYCIGVEYLSEIKQLDPLDEPKIIRSEDIISNCTEEVLVDDVLQELFDNETASCSTKCYESDSEMEGMVCNWEILEPTQVGADLTCDQLSTVEYAFEESTAVEEKSKESAIVNENSHKDGECETENDIFEMNPQLEDAENNCNTSVTDDAVDLLPSQIADISESSDETGNAESNKCQMHRETEADQILDVTSSGPQELPSGAAEYPIEEQDQVANYSYQGSDEATQDDAEFNDGQNHIIVEAQLEKISEDSNSTQELVNEIKPAQNFNHQLDGQQESTNDVENQNIFEKDQEGANKSKIPTSKGSEEQSDLNICKLNSAENETGVENMEVEVRTKSDVEHNSLMADNGTSTGSRSRYLGKESNSTQELADACSNRKWTIKCNKHIRDLEEERRFNPREPNFLPVVPDPEAEKVDLKRQIMDDRKNAEEWMLDYALQQAVTKLAPARKRKVALLVEAFETVLPIPKYDTHMRHTRSAFSHSRPIQACS